MPAAVPRRDEIPREHTWDLKNVFATDADWEAAIVEAKRLLLELDRFRGHLSEGPDILSDALEALDAITLIVGRVYVYASMLHDADTGDQDATAKNDRALALEAESYGAVSFINPELLSIGLETLSKWASNHPTIETYRHYFEKLEGRRDHVRSSDVEEILGLVTNPFVTARATHGVLADADLTFAPAVTTEGDTIAISQGNIDALLGDSDREVRRTAWENYADAHLQFKNTMASCLSAGIKQDAFLARVRGYSSSLEAALSPEHIPVEVFHNLIETYRRHLPTWHKYWRLRRESLGTDSLHEYDIKAPMILDPPRVPFDQAMQWIAAGMAPLGKEYVQIMRRGAEQQRWVDIYPNQGKRAGAYSSGWKGTHPFILMSYTDDIFSMSTLAHELGHSMHSYYSWQTQPTVYCDYSMFAAEVASNFNQALIRNYLFETNQDPRFQIALIDEAMANFHRYFFIMPALARFELEIHERTESGEPLTAEVLTGILGRIFKEGYGDEVTFDADRIGITWAEFPTHLYMNFYVFQYATGISAAHALMKRVLEGGEPAAKQYIDFLKSGGSLHPIDALRRAGVDMTSPQPVEEAFVYLDGVIDRLAGLLAKQGQQAAVAR